MLISKPEKKLFAGNFGDGWLSREIGGSVGRWVAICREMGG
jgi:hypothetical protein